MVRITIDLSKLEIEMFLNCVQGAIDTKHVVGKDAETAKKIMEQLNKHIQ